MENFKKKSRQSTFVPQIDDISVSEWKSLIKAFNETYPQIQEGISSTEKSWEYLLCTFFALVSKSIIGTNSPIASFYSLPLSNINQDKGFIRINDKKNSVSEKKFKGRRLYLPASAMIHLLSYYLHMSKEMSNEWVRHDRLVPQSLFPQVEFHKRYRAWISRLCNYAGIQKIPSIRSIVNLARIELTENYPSFVIGLFAGKVQYSPMPDMPRGKKTAFFADTKSTPNSIALPSIAEPSVLDDTLLAKVDLNYSKVSDYLSSLSMRSTKKERGEIADMIDTLWREEHPLLTKKPVASIDGMNFLLAADWLRAMLLYPRLTVNTIRTYFAQVSAVLRTELQGENLNGLNHGDMEVILENCNSGNSARVLKAALKSFLRYIAKMHKIEIGPISWRALSVETSMKEVQILWPSDVIKILAATDDPKIRQAIQLGFCCGMRISEIAYLNPQYIDVRGEAFLDIKITKSRSGKRRLPLYLLMSKKGLEEFASFYDDSCKNGCGKDVLFMSAEGLPFYNPQALSMAVERVMVKAGYAWATFHILRHSFASILLLRWLRTFVCSNLMDDWWQELQIYNKNTDRILIENGIHSIGALLGHADVRTTVENYIHTADLFQKAYRDMYERDNKLYLSYDQAINLTDYSKAGLYKRFPSADGNRKGIEATEIIELQLKRMKILIK
ncbi:MAG: hypothetical protein FJ240_12260 [Nitrospira sp.]|nr:hypothetical protein [Nitrospira sp.]